MIIPHKVHAVKTGIIYKYAALWKRATAARKTLGSPTETGRNMCARRGGIKKWGGFSESDHLTPGWETAHFLPKDCDCTHLHFLPGCGRNEM